MAAANLDTKKVTGQLNTVNSNALTAFDASAGAEFTCTSADNKTILVLFNSDASNDETVVIKAPANPTLGVGTGATDKSVTIKKGEAGVVMIESARYMNKDGKVKLTGSADVKGLVVEFK